MKKLYVGTVATLALLMGACTISVITPFSVSNLSVSTDYEDDSFYICNDATTEVSYSFNYEGNLASWTQALQEYKDDEFTGRTTLQRTVRPENSRATVTGNEVTFSFLVNPGEALEPQGVSPQQINAFVDTRLSIEVTSVDGQTQMLSADLPTKCLSDSGFGDATNVSVSPDFSESAGQYALSVGETRFYRVDLSEEVAATNDIVIVEANAQGEDDPFRVTAYNQEGDEVFASVTSDYFADASTVQTTDIDANQVCAGPCVAVTTSGAGSAYFSVENTSSEQTFDLFVVATPFIDETEPNESSSPAQVVEEQAAAIEYVGDEDFFQSTENASRVTLIGSPPELNLEFDVLTESGELLGSGNADTPYLIPENEPAQNLIARVYSGDERAGVGANANYTVRFDRIAIPVKAE